MELVKVERGEIYTDSLIYSEEFGILHRNLMANIRKLNAEISAPEKYWKLDNFVNKQGREYEKFLITKKGFMLLVMNTNAHESKKKKLFEIQEKFVEAFFELERQLAQIKVNQANVEWLNVRKQGKAVRKDVTDTIKDFVDYATGQGSTQAHRYYGNITKMEYKALGLMQQKVPKLRETLDSMQLFQLIFCEDLVKRQMKKYMEEKKHYKEIYVLVKQDLERFTQSLLLK